jgi:hypothetical protein
MEIETWHLWIIVAIILLNVKIFTPYLMASCLALGYLALCAIGGIKGLLNAGKQG